MKDAYYFTHDSNAKDDPKCVLLIEQLGLEGYGIFWVLVETLRDQPTYRYPIKLIPALARRYNTTTEKMKTVVLGYELFDVDENEFFFSRSLLGRMEKLDKKRELAQIAGKKSAEKRSQHLLNHNNSLSIQQTLNECSTDVQQTFNDDLNDSSTTVQPLQQTTTQQITLQKTTTTVVDVSLLKKYKITSTSANKLIRQFGAEQFQQQLINLNSTMQRNNITNPTGWLTTALKENFANSKNVLKNVKSRKSEELHQKQLDALENEITSQKRNISPEFQKYLPSTSTRSDLREVGNGAETKEV